MIGAGRSTFLRYCENRVIITIVLGAGCSSWLQWRMILQDGNSPVALRVVAGRVEERDADHRHRWGDRQRRNPPGNYWGRCRKVGISGFLGNWPEKESYETSIAENHLENRGHRNCSLDLPHSHLGTATCLLFFCMWRCCIEEAKPAISRSLLQVHFQWSNFCRSRSHFQPEKENISNQKSIFNLIKYFQSKKFPTRKTISFFIFYNMFILHWFLSKYFFPLILYWKKRRLTHFSSWNWSGHLNSGRLGMHLLRKKNYLQK